MRRLVAVVVGVVLIVPEAASAQSGSTRSTRPPLITWLDAATLVTGIGGSIALMGVDSRIARRLQGPRYQDNATYDDIADVAALVNEKSLFAAGLLTYGVAKLVHAPRTTTDIAWHTSESVFITSATATVVRGFLGRSRPFVTHDSDAHDYKPGKGFAQQSYRSYPSIHAASAFATAATLTAETARHSRRAAWVVGPITYSLASLPGLARMYKDKHWASDVAMGAALGAVSGWATVRYHHHRPGNRLDKVFLGATPSASTGAALGFTGGFTF
ncbi:MAG TPA: phosphatase PAP2 family protein [Gemmatimonadaceae bacterium]|nr:phosphatase PAP2 family protein [Gemmatimonadaceae bacterium]